MSDNFSRLRHEQKQEAQQEQRQEQQTDLKEYSTVEEVLRQDVAQTEVPAGIAVKLNQSTAALPQPVPKSWWQRLFRD